MADNTLYFAYGSNINLNQMEHRCPDASVVGPVFLDNYELLFRGAASPPLPQRRAKESTVCCGASRQSVSAPWIAMRAIPASTTSGW